MEQDAGDVCIYGDYLIRQDEMQANGEESGPSSTTLQSSHPACSPQPNADGSECTLQFPTLVCPISNADDLPLEWCIEPANVFRYVANTCRSRGTIIVTGATASAAKGEEMFAAELTVC